ncbi:RNA deprotection pyrophosphohydrolase [Staphylococcus massiliensis]|uniref:Nudix hydrolase domain-containing protein n=1 Tax=Staphylococcus massiliensis S46 TaxID=1229783 RepID=K9AW48_9STAP|nr:nucleoside triphosphatase YtkD [Staphylococcus massiliensis]EKU50301.1 hypothetical protein C273_01625 [Staphylococcus massiliensis S46]MCG3399673.1 nucleoside triphosphatase YtkD [Staphylococcus massiliensis]MCG3400778.1 nucleoside triphosphatase YtkD [Staphylococcus massiliensis]MCG3412058.1 nucleoside triphosphatase YtkD [Staphylococcus massiliensis]PNZ99050.1 nucleoside triphosphatase YtkD [Staphylococcus massiliensis CCUG 55927]
MIFKDKDNTPVHVTFKSDSEPSDGDHVLAFPIYQNQLLFTKHLERGIEFPGGKREAGESSIEALKRELFEETGATIEAHYFIAQYEVLAEKPFKKDVYVVLVSEIVDKADYLETSGPILFKSPDDVPHEERSFLIEDKAILKCLERVIELGFYKI